MKSLENPAMFPSASMGAKTPIFAKTPTVVFLFAVARRRSAGPLAHARAPLGFPPSFSRQTSFVGRVHASVLNHPPSNAFAGRYEPEVAKFVKEHGDALGIPKSPCTPEQERWEAISEQKRKQ